ncbi:MAG TPA: hypothetical protein VGM88_25425 [Kofleriaceae bacterium]
MTRRVALRRVARSRRPCGHRRSRFDAESAFVHDGYPSLELATRHPVLAQYGAPWRSLYFSGTPANRSDVAEAIERAIQTASASWRGLHDHECSMESVGRLLSAGHGMLMYAPPPTCLIASEILEPAGVRCSILGGAPARPGHRVVVLGPNYIVVRGFAFERI